MKHFVKGQVKSEKVILIYCPTNQMVIKNTLTKSLSQE
jgi:hypothetical protein